MMMREAWRRLLARLILCFAAVAPVASLAQDADLQAKAFMDFYSGLCVGHMTDFETLRQKIRTLPALPDAKASTFLAGKEGTAWPVDSKLGTFVLALHKGNGLCAFFARRVDAERVMTRFVQLVGVGQGPFKAYRVSDDIKADPRSGELRTIAYEWVAEGAKRKMLFVLTTATSDAAPFHAVATVNWAPL